MGTVTTISIAIGSVILGLITIEIAEHDPYDQHNNIRAPFQPYPGSRLKPI